MCLVYCLFVFIFKSSLLTCPTFSHTNTTYALHLVCWDLLTLGLGHWSTFNGTCCCTTKQQNYYYNQRIITKLFKTKPEISVMDRLPVCHKNAHTHTQESQRTCKGAVKKPQQIKPFPQAHIPRIPGNCHSSRLACCSFSYWSDLYRSTMLVFEIIFNPSSTGRRW